MNSSDTQNPETELNDLASSLVTAQKLIQGKEFSAAISALQPLLKSKPDEPEVLYMSAVCLRYTQQYDAALASLSQLKSVQPEHGRAHQEEGYNQRALGNTEKALKAFDRACFYNPALEASYRARIDIHNERNMVARALHVQEQLKQLLALPKPLIAVVDLISMGKLLRAEELCRAFLKKIPHHVEAMRLLADIGMRLGILEDAELLLHSASLLAPDNIPIHIDYIQVLRKRQQHLAAQEQARQLLEREPSNPQFQSIYAVQCMQSGHFDEALATFDELLKVLPNDPVTLTSQGHALKTKGESASAITSYQQAIAAYPRHGEAYFSLANLKTYRFSD
ncbi:MAG: tetratricopeptide (TPR) repeat protein, partial [Pseudohongiellaceae bacterium]